MKKLKRKRRDSSKKQTSLSETLRTDHSLAREPKRRQPLKPNKPQLRKRSKRRRRQRPQPTRRQQLLRVERRERKLREPKPPLRRAKSQQLRKRKKKKTVGSLTISNEENGMKTVACRS